LYFSKHSYFVYFFFFYGCCYISFPKHIFSRFGFLSGYFISAHSSSDQCLLFMIPRLFSISFFKKNFFFCGCSLLYHLISCARTYRLALSLFYFCFSVFFYVKSQFFYRALLSCTSILFILWMSFDHPHNLEISSYHELIYH
jgi:hypothetical protein